MDTTHLVSYLPFDASPTADLCGNSWTTYGNPTIGTSGAISGKALQLDGSSYLKRDSNFVFTGQPFTIGCRFSGTTRPSSGEVCIWQLYNGIASRIQMGFPSSGRLYLWKDSDSTVYLQTASNVFDGQNHYAEMDFDGSTWYFFVDGVLIGKKAHRPSAVNYTLYVGINYQTSKYFTGSIDEFQIYDGVALHTENFTPPTAEDYANISAPCTVTCDLQRTVKNAALTWRYENAGDADDLILTAPILRDLPDTKSKFGVAFYQTTRAKCFDLPATHEVWIKFDVYFDGSNRWRAYNGGTAGTCGVCSYAGAAVDFGMWQNATRIQDWTGICKTNQLQTVLLHMVSGASDGVIEAWVDGTFIYRYTGNVNQGNDFADIYLQSDGSGTFFSNVIISNAPIGLDEDVKLGDIVICDIQRRLANVVTTTADLQRRVINPAAVTADLQRRVVKSVTLTADLQRRLLDPTVTVTFDIQRRLSNHVDVIADIQRRVIKSVAETLDVARRLSNRVQVSFDVSRIVSNAGFISVNQSFDVARKIVKSINFSVDVARAVQKNWRYENAGTADDLITTDGETFIAGDDISYVQTNTGTAFYQTTRAKCFDLPATHEVWMKFDVYFDGSNRWRAYNGGTAGICGVCSYAGAAVDFGMWQNATRIQDWTGICKTNQLQTVLLHMVSGASDGVVEAWVDGVFIHRYTGNVNQGNDFADIYLQSDGSGTFFSNVIISNARIGLNDGFQIFNVDVARRISNVIKLNLDVARYVLKPVVVPFIGEHFNHFVPSFSVFAGVTHRIILPTNSKVFLRAKGTGILHVFSDTDPAGVLSSGSLFFHSDIYAELDYCNSVFVELATTVTPVQVMHALMFSLDNSTRIASYALDEAIEFATGGKFWGIAAVISQFIADLNAADSYSDFLQDKCDINLDNADTGAITGSDAGGSVTKTAHSVVPEFVPVNSWGVPASGSVTTVRGLSVRFPDDIDSLSSSAKFILAGLNSDWILQSLILIEQSFGISFNEADAFTHAIDVDFYSEDDGILAYVETDFDYDNNLSLLLCINLFYYADVDTNSEDGISPVAEGFLLDRTIAHEFVHAVMAATIHNFVDLPLWFKEGAAELVHGVDDERKEDIIELLTSRKDDLQAALNDEETSSGTDPYAAGYVFLRYLAKQGQHQSDIANLVIADLLISDGATDSDYNALTDNTRQVFAADIARNLIRSSALVLDVAIRAAVRVAFGIDVARAILAELILFPIDAPPVFNSSRLKAKAPLLKAAPDRSRNTPGLQSFEVNISEQQITEQVKVAGVIPFDIMQKVNGQYLDYHFDMRVEKIQQEGILYRCDCCADIDLLLYTQLNYTIPPSTWRKVGADNSTTDIQTYYPPASAHVQKIAAALGLTPVMQFDNFLSTVLMDENGGVTYADLIRDVFGWSSRVPTMLINCFIRDGKFFVIQRGHESRTVDISNAKCSLPVITKELVRTTWGSTPWSKTQTTEFQHSHWQAGIPDDVTLSGGGSDTQGGGDSDKKQVREVSTSFYGSDYQGYTTYTYDRKGLLVQTYTYVEKDINGISQETHTTVNHGYDDDNTMIYTETFVQSFGAEGDSSSKSIEEKGYTVLPNGEKFLAWEKSTTYQNNESISLSDSDLVDERVTVHSPSRLGQTHTVTIDTNGDIVGSAAGQNTGDDRVTPFARYNAAALGKSLFDSSSNTSSGSSGTWATDTETWETTIHGLALYDSSFPIHNEDKLYQVTQALRWLNRKTQETLTISLYEFPHLFDFNDRIIFNGNEYFLVNNTAMTTPRVFNEQNLTLRRWY